MIAVTAGVAAALWASCFFGECSLWTHGNSLVLATPVAENANLVRYRVDKVLWGPEEEMPKQVERARGGLVSIGDSEFRAKAGPQVLLAIPLRRPGSYGVSKAIGECDFGTFSLSDPVVKSFVEDRQRSWQASLRIRASIYGDRRVVAGMKVEVVGQNSKRFLETDERGIAIANHLEPGRYRVKAEKGIYKFGPVELDLTPLGCGTLQMTIPSPTTVSGRVFDASGRPVPDRAFVFHRIAAVTYDLKDQEWWTVRTDSEGRFVMKGLPEDEYYFGVNMKLSEHVPTTSMPPAFYPSSKTRQHAEMILVKDGYPVEGIELRLPDFGGRRRVTIEVVSASGLAISGASVMAHFDESRRFLAFESPYLKTDENGVVETEVWGEGRYLVSAIDNSRIRPVDLTPESSRIIEPGQGPVKIRIVKGPPASPAGSTGR
jgi:hypothetical protein